MPLRPPVRIESAGGAGTRRWGLSVWSVLFLVAWVLFIHALVGEKGFLATLRARQEYEAAERALEGARAENARLREEARRLREDPVAIEEEARRELGLMAPGEKVFTLRDRPAAGAERRQ